VNQALGRRAGRGVLSGEVVGGWDEGLREETRKWGAGEDFFAIVQPGDATNVRDLTSHSSKSTHASVK
jgi:hypothetical protein